ncbi:Uncharacterised protein [Moraxella caviae]|uniref:Uncharacterized protein n=1 Tax=Moraxella caviae TaxID=34060 RepID=A0A378R6X4_9GAMM|nr:Uncharacterised protein [Moraxella caviae]
MDKDYQEYKDFDMTGAIRGIPPQIARLQAKNQTNVKTEQARLLDDDVMAWVVRQDPRYQKYHQSNDFRV